MKNHHRWLYCAIITVSTNLCIGSAIASTASSTTTTKPTITPATITSKPTATVTSTASPSPTITPEIVFTDVPTNYWAYDAIQKVVQEKIMNGYGDGTFRPDQSITRAETTKVVSLATGKKDISKPKTIALPFTDVSPQDPLIPYIQYSYNNHIIKGYSNNTFRPGNPVSRAEFLKIFMLASSSVFKDYNSGEAFLDVPASHDLASYIYSAKALGYIQGSSNGLFYPNQPITRGEATRIIYLYLVDKHKTFADISDLEQKMLTEINDQRSQQNKSPLLIDDKLSEVARNQSQDLFNQWHFLSKEEKKNYESNNANKTDQDQQRPWTSHRNSAGLTFEQWFSLASKKYDINYSEATQNIAHAFYDGSTPSDRVADIIRKMFEKDSDSSYLYAHAYNLSGTYVNYTHIGIGIVIGDDPEEMYVTQILTK